MASLADQGELFKGVSSYRPRNWDQHISESARRKEIAARRLPPMPDCYTNPKDGICRWCGGNVQLPRRRWHADCVRECLIVTDAAYARRIVFERDHGACAKCGTVSRDWELDHVVPLWSVDRDAPGALAFWQLANMQTLCPLHHKEKTAAEAGQRSGARKIQAAESAGQERLF